MAENYNFKDIASKFDFKTHAARYGNGHINDTFLVENDRYLIQRMSTNLCKEPERLMDSIVKVTSFLSKKIIEDGGDPEKETLTVIKTGDGKNCYHDGNGNYFRMYKFIENMITVNSNPTTEQIYQAAKGFGKFIKRLDDFPVEELFEVIPNFHNTPDRFNKLLEAIENNVAGRKDSVKEEIDFALSCKPWISKVVDGLNDGSIPYRVTHNDTKINNVLFDPQTGEATCVIDLDTVMPGSLLYDFGDTLRIGAATADEDETDLSKVHFNLEMFESFTKGFFEEMAKCMTDREIELLGFSAKLLTYECGIRFLTDYLNGDTYFKIHRDHHNLDRARTQFKLVQEMEEKSEEIENIVKKYREKYGR